MSEVAVQASTPEQVVSAVIMQLSEGQVEDATSSFAEEFRFKDHGIELEFTAKGRLTEFFQKTRELIVESGNTTFINAKVLDATNAYVDS
jgi:hypothetical protein